MGIRRVTPEGHINNYLLSELAKKEAELIESLKYVGEQALTEARDNKIYLNQTGNLQSSTGYVILKNGVIIFGGGFNQVKKGSSGVAKGRKFIAELIKEYREGIVLVMVAGMNYATYVEAMNLNVLASSEILANNLVPKMLTRLGLR